MIYKSYIVEQNIKDLKENCILFYGENLGLKNEIKDKIRVHNKDSEIIIFNQECESRSRSYEATKISSNLFASSLCVEYWMRPFAI